MVFVLYLLLSSIIFATNHAHSHVITNNHDENHLGRDLQAVATPNSSLHSDDIVCSALWSSAIKFITSFNMNWYNHMGGSFSDTVLEKKLNQPIVAYHESDLPHIEGACKVDLRVAYPWIDYELSDPSSGFNKYENLSTHYNPNTGDVAVGSIRVDAVLMLKVMAIHHAVHSSKENTIVFWCDTDVTFREDVPPHVLNWLLMRDITYIPFHNILFGAAFSPEKEDQAFMSGIYRVETGLVAITVNHRTRALMDKAIELYRGGMHDAARLCLDDIKKCAQNIYICQNLYLNDIYVFAILLNSDAHKNPFFHVGLRQGWFAMKGLEYKNETWGMGRYEHFEPSTNQSSIRTNFHIGKYVYHHFGLHKKGGLAVQFNHGAMHQSQKSMYRRKTVKKRSESLMDKLRGGGCLGR